MHQYKLILCRFVAAITATLSVLTKQHSYIASAQLAVAVIQAYRVNKH
jgi:hypothetical protein